MSDLLKSAESILDILALTYLGRKARRYRAGRARQPMVVFAHDFIGNEIGVRGRYEDAELRALTPVIRELKDGAVLDIGANIGNHTLFFSEFFQEVHAFEPNPRTLELLRLNTARVKHVKVHGFGLSDQTETLTAFVPVTNIGGASISYHQGRSAGEIEKQTFVLRRFDEISAEIQAPIALVKIDVEGHEPQVVRGLENMLRKELPLVLFEHNGSSMTLEGSDDVPSLLRRFGYNQFHSLVSRRIALPSWLPKAVKWPVRGVERLLTQRDVGQLMSLHEFVDQNYPIVVASVRAKHNVVGAQSTSS